MKKLLLLLVIVASSTINYAQDALAFTVKDEVYNASNALDVSITYTSDVEIAAGAVEVTLWTVSGGVWSQQWRDSDFNKDPLPAGTDLTSTITIESLPAAIVNGDGNLMTNEELLAADPNPAPTGFTTYYYELRFTVRNQTWADLSWITEPAVDVNFTPTIPAASFIHVDPSTTASIDEEFLKDVKLFPNPTTGKINISGLETATAFSVYNAIGQEVKRFKNVNSTIDISELNSGIYILKSNNGLLRKIVKQ
ncbi:hypothetical protein BW723_03890 [Polaribacter reichenbachii]|uniref:Secretion system C-terminal sorting domain-containing protein n=2 Tax=Polaribacter reichenbachii TaxID=996801 RepID=A0A1B8TVA9_9FLAO|nr:T9SS type A sorting domain-containing protein [Polaribacter reichenbachii]APZ45490.1 hypothetical protein BW723_03890 [Polaribacter reichenbachii]AUC19351.1 hypothetical protein BTO17_11895 [Polaribacter reichenbachii]OBY63494.1 hypothetical protein LPB301_11815 [Polaribacter reichenbachii]